MTDRVARYPRLARVYWALRLFGLPEPVRDLWMIALTAILVVVLNGQDAKIDRQREGRRVAIEVLCGGQQGVIDAGRGQLLRFGERGAAAEYARVVARAIEREAGIRGLLDVRTSQLQCGRLLRESGATP